MESETLVIDSTDFIKSLEIKDGKAIVGAYAIQFSGPDQKDLTGEYFTKETYLGSHHGDGADVLFNHGFAPTKAFDEICGRIFASAKAVLDEVGVFVQHTLDLADEYEAAIAKLVAAGKLKWSSGTASHLAKKSATGEIQRWPIAEFSYTPTPAEPRLPAIAPLKSVVIPQAQVEEFAAAIGVPKSFTAASNDFVEGRVVEMQTALKEDPPVDNPPKADPTPPIPFEIMDPEIQEKIDAEVKARTEKFQKDQETIKAEVERRDREIREIYAIGDKFGKRDEASRFVLEGKSLAEFSKFILDRLNAQGMKALSLIPEPDTKTMRRRDFDGLTVGQRNEFLKSRGRVTD
jgi:hypothetical protein